MWGFLFFQEILPKFFQRFLEVIVSYNFIYTPFSTGGYPEGRNPSTQTRKEV